MNKSDLITINDAVVWASEYTKKSVTISNISYLIQYALQNMYIEFIRIKESLFLN